MTSMHFKLYLLKHMFFMSSKNQLLSAKFFLKEHVSLSLMHTTHPFIYMYIHWIFSLWENKGEKMSVVCCHTRNSAYNSTTPMFTTVYREHGIFNNIQGTSTDARRRKQERSSSAHRVISWHGVDNQSEKGQECGLACMPTLDNHNYWSLVGCTLTWENFQRYHQPGAAMAEGLLVPEMRFLIVIL